jgi:glutaredoxin
MKEIEMYSVEGCRTCTLVKEHLNNNDISFTEKDVQKNADWCEELKSLTGQVGVPVTVIDGKILMGFPQLKFDEILEL